MRIYFSALLLLSFLLAFSQTTFPVNGVQNDINTVYALTHATVYTTYNVKIENAVMLVKGEHILNLGADIAIPSEAVEINCTGKMIYPSFIDAFTSYGMPESKGKERNGRPQYISDKKGAYDWNEAIRSEYNAVDNFAKDERISSQLRSAGFGAVYTFKNDGIARGTGAIVTLNDSRENNLILRPIAGANYSFNKGSSSQDYPSSLMGSIALLRQTYYDAQWYQTQSNQTNLSLKAFNEMQGLTQFFDAGDQWNVLRADRIGDEFKVQYVIKTNGMEYKRIAQIKETNATLIVPLNFPAPFNVADAYDAQQISTSDMMHWYLAPSNLYFLQQNKVPFCITSNGCDANSFLKNLRKAVVRGLSEEEALKALTQTPATLLNVADKVGALKAGMLANFIISSGNIFRNNTSIYENWVQGNRFILGSLSASEVRGTYIINFGKEPIQLVIEGDVEKPILKLHATDTIKGSLEKKSEFYLFTFDKQKYKTMVGWYNQDKNEFKGTYLNQEGATIPWSAKLIKPYINLSKEVVPVAEIISLNDIKFPFNDYGSNELPKAQKILFKNATVWTNEAAGIQEQTDVLIIDGKIAQIGKGLQVVAGILILDATGKHLTAGIVDEHSHIAISGDVNEGTQSVTSEVRIGDVVWPDDINIYRQLAGGVTTSHLLHGSANAIGGQSQLIKLRWGKSAEQMKFEGWDGFIKFALGENVKQSNWGDRQTVRYPQTRMGVEQVLYDAFSRAKTYDLQWKNFKGVGTCPRRDLELDALAEILNKKRFITCHSYVQSEINMLMHVGDSMGFKVNTFTHILEGYKVADKMKAHGANASTFADWWAYKFEVYDAIPYNSALMSRVGVNVGVNSDDAEMARRLNQEAAKAIKYGGLTAQEALKLCTLNPAKMLHIDNRVGSIKVGKDADLVLWSDAPLSIYAKPLYTLVDGIIYFDYSQQEQKQKQILADRALLIQQMNEAIKAGDRVNVGVSQPQLLNTCEGDVGGH